MPNNRTIDSMLLSIQDTIKKLQSYQQSPAPILSVYLGVSDKKEKLPKRFASLLKQSLPEYQEATLRQNIEYIRAYLEQFSSQDKYRGIALFSGGKNLWEVVTTEFKLPDRITLSHSPDLGPLLHELDTYKRYLVILADRERTRLYTLYLGAIEDKEDFRKDDVHQKVKAQGSPELEKNIDSHIRDELQKHFDFVADKVKEFVERKPLAGVVVGGHQTSLHDLENHLPKQIRQKIIGTFTADTDLDDNTLIAKSKEVIEKEHSVPKPEKTKHFTPI